MQHSLEFKELQRRLDNEDETKKFMDEKGEDRGSVEQAEVMQQLILLVNDDCY